MSIEKPIELSAKRTLNCENNGYELSRESRDNGVQNNAWKQCWRWACCGP